MIQSMIKVEMFQLSGDPAVRTSLGSVELPTVPSPGDRIELGAGWFEVEHIRFARAGRGIYTDTGASRYVIVALGAVYPEITTHVRLASLMPYREDQAR